MLKDHKGRIPTLSWYVLLKSIVLLIRVVNKGYSVHLCHLKFQNEAKMTDQEKVLLFLIMLYLLEQNRRLTLYRLLLYSFLLQRMRILEMQRVAVQHFTTFTTVDGPGCITGVKMTLQNILQMTNNFNSIQIIGTQTLG